MRVSTWTQGRGIWWLRQSVSDCHDALLSSKSSQDKTLLGTTPRFTFLIVETPNAMVRRTKSGLLIGTQCLVVFFLPIERHRRPVPGPWPPSTSRVPQAVRDQKTLDRSGLFFSRSCCLLCQRRIYSRRMLLLSFCHSHPLQDVKLSPFSHHPLHIRGPPMSVLLVSRARA